MTTNAWDRIHIDFAGPIEGFNYLIIIDAFSKWLEIIRMNYKRAQQIFFTVLIPRNTFIPQWKTIYK